MQIKFKGRIFISGSLTNCSRLNFLLEYINQQRTMSKLDSESTVVVQTDNNNKKRKTMTTLRRSRGSDTLSMNHDNVFTTLLQQQPTSSQLAALRRTAQRTRTGASVYVRVTQVRGFAGTGIVPVTGLKIRGIIYGAPVEGGDEGEDTTIVQTSSQVEQPAENTVVVVEEPNDGDATTADDQINGWQRDTEARQLVLSGGPPVQQPSGVYIPVYHQRNHAIDPKTGKPNKQEIYVESSVVVDIPPGRYEFQFTVWTGDKKSSLTVRKIVDAARCNPYGIVRLGGVRASYGPILGANYRHGHSVSAKGYDLTCDTVTSVLSNDIGVRVTAPHIHHMDVRYLRAQPQTRSQESDVRLGASIKLIRPMSEFFVENTERAPLSLALNTSVYNVEEGTTSCVRTVIAVTEEHHEQARPGAPHMSTTLHTLTVPTDKFMEVVERGVYDQADSAYGVPGAIIVSGGLTRPMAAIGIALPHNIPQALFRDFTLMLANKNVALSLMADQPSDTYAGRFGTLVDRADRWNDKYDGHECPLLTITEHLPGAGAVLSLNVDTVSYVTAMTPIADPQDHVEALGVSEHVPEECGTQGMVCHVLATPLFARDSVITQRTLDTLPIYAAVDNAMLSAWSREMRERDRAGKDPPVWPYQIAVLGDTGDLDLDMSTCLEVVSYVMDMWKAGKYTAFIVGVRRDVIDSAWTVKCGNAS